MNLPVRGERHGGSGSTSTDDECNHPVVVNASYSVSNQRTSEYYSDPVLTKPLLEYYGQTSPKPVRSQALQRLQSESFDVF
ncbi:MAG: hypothetical protein VYE62_11045 [Pseudomonadota bacterium]|nr:hypothetical protein [Pseudomonadota bacterium]